MSEHYAINENNDHRTRSSEEIAADNWRAAAEWCDELNELAGHHLIVEVDPGSADPKQYAKVRIGFDERRRVGDPKVEAAVIAAREAFERMLHFEHLEATRKSAKLASDHADHPVAYTDSRLLEDCHSDAGPGL